jgi:hypothetical protein
MATGDDGTIYIAPFVREHPLVLILFHPEGKLPGYKEERKQTPIDIQPMYSVSGTSYTDDREWQAFRRDYRSRKRVFVTEGSLIARELGWPGKTPAIPAGESGISALVLLNKQIIYGTTSGQRSHLFKFDPSPEREGPLNSVVDLGVMPTSSEGVVCQSLVVAADNNLYMGTYGENGEDGHLYQHDAKWELLAGFDQFMIPRYVYKGQQIVDLGAPIPGEGIYAIAAIPRTEFSKGQTLLCGITYPNGFLFLYDVGKKSTVFKTQIKSQFLPRALGVTPEGLVYGSQQDGQLFRFDPKNLEVESLQIWLPAMKGREYLNAIDSLVLCEDGTFYGGTGADGFLFRFDPHKEKIISVGKPTRADRIRGLTVSRSGEVFGIAGDDNVITHLFRLNPANGDLRDLGILRATLPDEWIGHEFNAIISGPSGEIYLGESDRVSRLFTYFPPY